MICEVDFYLLSHISPECSLCSVRHPESGDGNTQILMLHFCTGEISPEGLGEMSNLKNTLLYFFWDSSEKK